MKKIILVSLLLAPFFAFAESTLDGSEFCRTFVSGGVFGQPEREVKHCVSFDQGIMTDNANTFFGNPPEALPYRITEGGVVETERDGKWIQNYVIEEKTLVNLGNLNQVLVLVEEKCD